MIIKINSKKYTVKISVVGNRFGTLATIRVGGRKFESDIKPFGFDSAAETDLYTKVIEKYPNAIVSE